METKNPWDQLTEPAPRTPRSLDTRESAERTRTWTQPSVLPELPPRDGWSHKWVRTDARNSPDKINYGKKLREGWEPIDVAEYPELATFVGNQEHGRVEVGGLVACRMPMSMVQERRAHYLGRARDAESSAEEHYMRDQNELVKKIATNSRRVVFGNNSR